MTKISPFINYISNMIDSNMRRRNGVDEVWFWSSVTNSRLRDIIQHYCQYYTIDTVMFNNQVHIIDEVEDLVAYLNNITGTRRYLTHIAMHDDRTHGRINVLDSTLGDDITGSLRKDGTLSLEIARALSCPWGTYAGEVVDLDKVAPHNANIEWPIYADGDVSRLTLKRQVQAWLIEDDGSVNAVHVGLNNYIVFREDPVQATLYHNQAECEQYLQGGNHSGLPPVVVLRVKKWMADDDVYSYILSLKDPKDITIYQALVGLGVGL